MIVAVPLALSVKNTPSPAGKPVSVSEGVAEKPAVVTLNVPGVPTVKVVLFELVIAGGTISVKS